MLRAAVDAAFGVAVATGGSRTMRRSLPPKSAFHDGADDGTPTRYCQLFSKCAPQVVTRMETFLDVGVLTTGAT